MSHDHHRSDRRSLLTPRGLCLCAVVVAALAALACSTTSPHIAPLLNQGLIPVSSDNPYVGSNLFLGKEMERSTYLYNFLRQRGAPQAIELRGPSEGSAEARLYYSGRREYYIATPSVDKATKTREWNIRGPYAVERENFRQVSLLPATDRAVVEVFGRKEIFGQEAIALERKHISPAFVPTPTPVPTPRPRPIKKPTGQGGAAAATPTPATPMNFDQRALMEAKEFAERAPNGDVVHTVKAPTETLTSISNWYSGSSDNTKKVAEKNNLPEDTKLTPGTKIFIPADIVTNAKTMKD